VLALGAVACGRAVAPPTAGPTVTSLDHPSRAGDAVTDPPTGPAADADTAPEGRVANPHESIAAQLTGSSVAVHAEPAARAPVVTTLGASTALGSRTTLLVVEQRDGWVQVRLPIRPNGTTGWIRADEVELRANPMAIHVDLANHALSLTHDGDVVLETKVAIGSTANPTPAGDYYVTDLVDTDAPGGAYGPFAFGLSGHSDTLTEFGGGDGQLGIHGTDDPSSIGRSVSHGCVRVPNEIVTQLVDLVPLGTPVTVA
jgi:lipoprotein-anchoring transpeptidase ErfK/SrfK